MALSAPVVDDTKTESAATNTLTSASFSPTGGALLIVVLGVHGTLVPSSFSFSDTFTGSGSWTVHQTAVQAQAALVVATMQLGASPGAGTVTASWTNNSIRKVMHSIEVTGQNMTTPVAQSNKNNGTTSTLTVTLGATPAADSMVLGGIISVSATGVTPGGAFTELIETNQTGPPNQRTEVQYDQDSAATTCDWSGLATTANAGVAIEIAAAAAAGGPPIDHMQPSEQSPVAVLVA